jgi:hypothetical protein
LPKAAAGVGEITWDLKPNGGYGKKDVQELIIYLLPKIYKYQNREWEPIDKLAHPFIKMGINCRSSGELKLHES